VRDECLNINMFWSLAQARLARSAWGLVMRRIGMTATR
jgi:hypothetical protein